MENNYIKLALKYCDLVRSTLGPKGRNKMVKSGDKILVTNDGATIMKNIKIDNPIGDLFKRLSVFQEESIGDGTTTTIVIAGALLELADDLINKGIHPITIIEGYNLARDHSINFLNKTAETGDITQIIKTCLGNKVNSELKEKITKTILKLKKKYLKDLKFYKKDNNFTDIKLISGYGFDGFTRNSRMKTEINGNIALLDFKVNLKTTEEYHLKDANQLMELERMEKEFANGIVKKLQENKINCVFYTDTSKEFESYLTNSGITGILLRRKDDIDNICNSLNIKAVPDYPSISQDFVNTGKVFYDKGSVTVESENSKIRTLVLSGQTLQVLEEIQRSVEDVITILKLENKTVTGAGSAEIELANEIRNLSLNVNGKVSIPFEKFADAVESVPMTIAKNGGLDCWEVLTRLRNRHKTNENIGIDFDDALKISDAKKRGIIEPVMIKIGSIVSAIDVVNLILKMDAILVGEGENENNKKN